MPQFNTFAIFFGYSITIGVKLQLNLNQINQKHLISTRKWCII